MAHKVTVPRHRRTVNVIRPAVQKNDYRPARGDSRVADIKSAGASLIHFASERLRDACSLLRNRSSISV
jgi:hypothetical protein